MKCISYLTFAVGCFASTTQAHNSVTVQQEKFNFDRLYHPFRKLPFGKNNNDKNNVTEDNIFEEPTLFGASLPQSLKRKSTAAEPLAVMRVPKQENSGPAKVHLSPSDKYTDDGGRTFFKQNRIKELKKNLRNKRNTNMTAFKHNNIQPIGFRKVENKQQKEAKKTEIKKKSPYKIAHSNEEEAQIIHYIQKLQRLPAERLQINNQANNYDKYVQPMDWLSDEAIHQKNNNAVSLKRIPDKRKNNKQKKFYNEGQEDVLTPYFEVEEEDDDISLRKKNQHLPNGKPMKNVDEFMANTHERFGDLTLGKVPEQQPITPYPTKSFAAWTTTNTKNKKKDLPPLKPDRPFGAEPERFAMAPVFPPAPPVEGLPAMAKQLYMGKKTVVEEEEVEEELLRPNNYMNYKPQVQKQVNAQQIQKVADKRKRGKVEVPKQQKNMEKKNKKMRAGKPQSQQPQIDPFMNEKERIFQEQQQLLFPEDIRFRAAMKNGAIRRARMSRSAASSFYEDEMTEDDEDDFE